MDELTLLESRDARREAYRRRSAEAALGVGRWAYAKGVGISVLVIGLWAGVLYVQQPRLGLRGVAVGAGVLLCFLWMVVAAARQSAPNFRKKWHLTPSGIRFRSSEEFGSVGWERVRGWAIHAPAEWAPHWLLVVEYGRAARASGIWLSREHDVERVRHWFTHYVQVPSNTRMQLPDASG